VILALGGKIFYYHNDVDVSGKNQLTAAFAGAGSTLTQSIVYSPQGGFQFYIRVSDEDVAFDDHVDDVYADVSLSPSSSFTSVRTFTGDHGNSRIALSFRVRCSANYYGSNCATYCVRTDNSRGHYTCGSNGQQICLPGWSAANCLTREFC
jgi:hypothetical protein